MILHDKTGQTVAQRFWERAIARTGQKNSKLSGHCEHTHAPDINTNKLRRLTTVARWACSCTEKAYTGGIPTTPRASQPEANRPMCQMISIAGLGDISNILTTWGSSEPVQIEIGVHTPLNPGNGTLNQGERQLGYRKER